MEADEWLSQGLPFPPPTEEEERRKKEAEEERKRKEEEEEEARKKAEEEEKRLAKLEGDADKNRADREKRLEEKRKKREAEEKKRKEAEERANAPKEAFNWESINPLASLQKQMDEVFAMITMSQNILDEAASCAERVAGILSWEEPRVTAGVLVVILALAWALVYVEIVTRFFIKIVLGVVVKTIFKIVSPATIKFGISCGVLFARGTRSSCRRADATRWRPRARGARGGPPEAALEAAGGDDEDEEEEAAVVGATAAGTECHPDPRLLAPLNVFFRGPRRATGCCDERCGKRIESSPPETRRLVGRCYVPSANSATISATTITITTTVFSPATRRVLLIRVRVVSPHICDDRSLPFCLPREFCLEFGR